jgi:hypothetical protein
MRMFLAKKSFAEEMSMYTLVTRHASATKIQASWRSYCAQVQMLLDLVNVIVIQVSATTQRGSLWLHCHLILSHSLSSHKLQSLWRRRCVVVLYGPLLNRMKLARLRKQNRAATKIQSAWRGFMCFSTYVSSIALIRFVYKCYALIISDPVLSSLVLAYQTLWEASSNYYPSVLETPLAIYQLFHYVLWGRYHELFSIRYINCRHSYILFQRSLLIDRQDPVFHPWISREVLAELPRSVCYQNSSFVTRLLG